MKPNTCYLPSNLSIGGQDRELILLESEILLKGVSLTWIKNEICIKETLPAFLTARSALGDAHVYLCCYAEDEGVIKRWRYEILFNVGLLLLFNYSYAYSRPLFVVQTGC
jgi:hypothetical protein